MGRVKIVVIGAGVAGAATAWHAARLGAEVVVVDGGAVGQATAAGAGIVCPWASRTTDVDWYRLARAAARYYPELVDSFEGADIGYRRVGALRLEPTAELRRLILERRSAAPEAGEISSVTGAELFPPLRPDVDALFIAGGARVDGGRLRAALLAGHPVRSGTARLVVRGDRVRGVEVAGDLIEADAVVVAAGAWTAEVLAPHGIRVDVQPQRGQIIHLRMSGVDTGGWPVVLPASTHYLLAFADSRVVVGATRETGSGFDYRRTAAGLAEVLTEALRVAPGLADAEYVETRIGFRPMGPDARPLLGLVPGLDGLVIATGLGANGLTLGPYAGLLAARLALGEPPETDLAAYDPLR